MINKNEVLKVLAVSIRELLCNAILDFLKLQEIRMRMNQPLMVEYDGASYFISKEGTLTRQVRESYIVRGTLIAETLNYISNYSLYAFEEEVKQGFITIPGGHRVGIAGKVIYENGMIKSMKYITYLNIRMSHEIVGCATPVLPYLFVGQEFLHTLIISPPRCGKTTLLRDLIRNLSNGTSFYRGKTVGVVDERSEIGGSYMGVPQNDVGIQTDLLDCCPKEQGMLMLIRSMSPEIIAIDEIGKIEEIEAICYALFCGCQILATVHGTSLAELKRKPVLKEVLEKQIFQRYILLGNREKIGQIQGIFDEKDQLSKVNRKMKIFFE